MNYYAIVNMISALVIFGFGFYSGRYNMQLELDAKKKPSKQHKKRVK